MKLSKTLLLACAVLLNASACASELPPITPVAHVDLPRFMGNWYVIASIPTRFEKNAYDALEVYTLKPDGDVATSFHFREGSFDGEKKDIHSTGIVKPGSGNAVWGVQVFWPLKAQYIVAWLKDDYSQVIVARDARDYTWVMARTPTIPQADYDALLARVQALGYPMNKVRKVPQQARQ
ncbi:lipocalin family protein [Rhodanobacter sp. OR87]|uniref:lipocalin family protein n=1 Tax=Rhodanobacter sp. OR87 TaxID=1076523 RepID=UPI0004248BCD|nr:lipocalin family protein [Rhodanobacter sp. OR87]